jgi:hypothetical protein
MIVHDRTRLIGRLHLLFSASANARCKRALPTGKPSIPFGLRSTRRKSRNSGSRPISRVLSWTIIHLGPPSPTASSNLPESTAGRGIAFLFGLAPGGVYHAAVCCHLRGALLPHHFTLTPGPACAVAGRFIFCCTFRRLAPPRSYLAPCPMEPGLSSPLPTISRNRATAWPTPRSIFPHPGAES